MQAARGTSIAQTPSTTPAYRLRLRWLFGSVALSGLAADALTKFVVVDRLQPQAPVRLLGGLLTLRLIRNPGAAFSLGERYTYVFALLSAVVLAVVVVRVVPRLGHPGWAVALGLLCAGVAGNLSDRLFRPPGFLRGHVVDFLQLPHWPIFNVADMCITGAAVLILILSTVNSVSVGGERVERPRVPSTSAEPGLQPGERD